MATFQILPEMFGVGVLDLQGADQTVYCNGAIKVTWVEHNLSYSDFFVYESLAEKKDALAGALRFAAALIAN